MLRSLKLSPVAAAAFAVGVGITGHAEAQAVACSSLPNPLYGNGGSAITPTLAQIAVELRKLDPPINLVFQDPSACAAFSNYVAGAAMEGNGKYFDDAGVVQNCTFPLGGGPVPAFSTMGNGVPLCNGQTLPADVGDFEGPIQTVNIITARGSSETSISAEALHYIFGKGDGQVSPWNDEAWLVKRTATSFVHLFVATAAQIPATGFKADTEVTTNPATIAAIRGFASKGVNAINGSLGYVSGPNAEDESVTGDIKTLAYQHFGQTCGYWPNSSEGSRDKANVRNGQYHLWAPNHFYTKVDATTREIVDPRVKTLVRLLTGDDSAPAGVELNRKLVESGNVPQCAMQVKRAGDLGATSSWAPAIPCNCTFDLYATGSTSCQTCPGGQDSECTSGGKCRNNYCEAY